MADGASLNLRRLTPAEAAARLQGLEGLDPSGMTASPEDIARAGMAFGLEGDAGDACFVVAVRNGVAFVVAAKGGGSVDMTEVLDQVITAQARNARGVNTIGCQTARPGLVRKLQRRGWRVSGWILRKDL